MLRPHLGLSLLFVALTSFACSKSTKKAPEPQKKEKTPPKAAEAPKQPVSQPSSQPEKPIIALPKTHSGAPLGENRSGFGYQTTKDNSCDGQQLCRCTGSIFHGLNALKQLGLDEKQLANGADCLLADFDGNGHTDGVFLAPPTGDKARTAKVLLFDALGVSKVADLPQAVKTLRLEQSGGKAVMRTGEGPEAPYFVWMKDKFRVAKAMGK